MGAQNCLTQNKNNIICTNKIPRVVGHHAMEERYTNLFGRLTN